MFTVSGSRNGVFRLETALLTSTSSCLGCQMLVVTPPSMVEVLSLLEGELVE